MEQGFEVYCMTWQALSIRPYWAGTADQRRRFDDLAAGAYTTLVLFSAQRTHFLWDILGGYRYSKTVDG
jgi:hypothetical protein